MRAHTAFWLVAVHNLHPPFGGADGTTAPPASVVRPSDKQYIATLDRTTWRGFPATSVSPYGPSRAQSQGGAGRPVRFVEESQEDTPKHRSVQEVEIGKPTGSDLLRSITGTSEQGVGNPTPNRCRDFNLSKFGKGQSCGPPLSLPCFDYDRCQLPPEGKLTIYVYDYDCTLADSDKLLVTHESDDTRHQSSYWREAARDAGLLAETYESACLFIHVNNHAHKEPCATSAPLWNDGANHIMMEFTDWSRDMRRSISDSYAMEGASNMHSCYYRSGYDISVPLFPKAVFPEFSDIPPLDRQYFLTTKGTVYLGGHGSEERMSVIPLHDEANGVIAVMTCFDLHDEQLLPENVDYCEANQARYDAFDYDRLMNTTFGLIPGGRSPGTFRLGEVMSSGAIPVMVVRDWVPPFREQIDWPSFSFAFTPDQVGPEMVAILRSIPADVLKDMQRKSMEAYWAIFGGTTDYKTISRGTVEILNQRFQGHA